MHYWSKHYIPTLKESPAEAEIDSHKLLLRAGLVRKIGSGMYAFLPLGSKALENVTRICREEMEKAGAMEVLMPAIVPADYWKAGPRWNVAREIMYQVSSAGEGAEAPEEPQFVLGPTHEEIITPLIGGEASSYRDMGKTFFQVQTKFRNEIRPRYGLMRAREFIMKDGYSFDATDEEATETYKRMAKAYEGFFGRCGLKFISVEADTGVMGGAFSHEFMVPADVGDDDVVYNLESGYAANVEKATSGLVPDDFQDAAPAGEVEKFETPGVTTIAGLAKAPYEVPAEAQFKTLVFIGDDKPFVVVLRGCDELEEAKLGSLGYQLARPATPEEIESLLGAKPGSLGVAKGTIKDRTAIDGIYADEAIRLIGNGVTGANEDGFHLRNVSVQRDLDIDRFGDFRKVKAGEPCPRSGKPLEIQRAIEVGHIFKLGTKYSENEQYGAIFVDKDGNRQPAVMGCYGIGISRTLQSVIEQCHDGNGIVWPWSVAPYQILITVLDPGVEEADSLALRLGEVAEAEGASVLVDDRAERPGVKFKDADLIGIPLRLTIGGRGLKNGEIEMKWRHESDVQKIAIADAEATLREAIKSKAQD
ncbi:proline--tRNA ligase [Pelagicoccus sp. SDUM812003]|uniref:proline--tRNA ligase n=1 Tax=Pelagicoccus sp. SDUM812003 TaxID=3041267 RepID=UPI00280F4855|nr:proline--tRNA ligase [Pelagicoccus sp. SDUM812003]MDQ8205569.1 proline--tRNA ligase [Pelagicoccus sp. SDUM812003]